MAQRKQLTWTELRVGLFVLVGLFILAVAIFYITGAGILGPKYRLYTYLPEVEGVAAGAPVRLDGVAIGNVEKIGLNPHPTDRTQSIQLILRIDKKFSSDVRTDSTASLVTEGLLGDRYVTIKRGLSGSPLKPESTIPAAPAVAMTEMVERGTDLLVTLNTVSGELRGIVDQVKNGQGTVGKLIADPALYNNVNATVSRLNSMVGSIQEGKGTVGKLVASDELYTKVNTTVDNVNDVIGAVKEQKGTAGKLIYDPAVYNSARGFLDNGNAVLSDVRAGKGSLGKFATDEALYNNLRDASAQVRDASAKLNSNQGTAGKLFTDPNLYDNLTGMTGDLRLLIGDFRKDPKKFLHVKLAVF
jgi:phospholipid/cholesterol/gamma-HCH transport system substrate-binding protein